MARIELIGMQKHLGDIKTSGARGREDVFRWVTRLAFLTQRRAVEGIQRGPKSGRIYQKYNPRRTHRASAPGQYPATDTGRLASSIAVEPPSNRENPVARVGTAVRYGLYLEKKAGSRGGRPWLGRSLSAALAEMKGDLGKGLR